MPDNTIKDREIRDTLAAAEAHFTRYEWDEALACFKRVLDEAPNHGAAVDGQRRVAVQQGWDREIQQKIADARLMFQQRNYPQALSLLDAAQSLGADHHILKYHAEIDVVRNEIAEYQRWEQRIRTETTAAERLSSRDVDGAIAILDTLLRDLAGTGLGDLGAAPRALADQLTARAHFEAQLTRAESAYNNQDYELAATLCEALNQQARGNRQVAALLGPATNDWRRISEQLRVVEAALNEDNLPDAVAILQNLQRDYPNNPNWQALWLKGHMKQAQASTERGRLALPNRDFDRARTEFEEAQAAYQAVLNVFPAHPLAEPGRNEAAALHEVATFCLQAQRDLSTRHWEGAREALQAAQEKLVAASNVRNTRFKDISAALQAFQAEVQTTIDEVRQARTRLTEGEQKLKDHEPDRAEADFRQGLDVLQARDNDLQQRLANGLREADRVQQDVRRLSEQAKRSGDAQESLRLFKMAHDAWPSAPGLLDDYVETLLTAGEAASQRADQKQAAACYELLLALPRAPGDKTATAKQRLDDIGADQAVQATLQLARTQRAALEAATAPRSEEWQALVDRLVRAREQAGSRRELGALVEPELRSAEARLQAIRRAEPLLRDAELKETAGAWNEAARLGQAGLDALGDLSAADWRQRAQAWKEKNSLIETTLQQARAAYAQAQEMYKAGSKGDANAIEWSQLDEALADAAQRLATRPADVAMLPAEWHSLEKEVQGLQATSQTIRQALKRLVEQQTLDGLAILSQAVVARPQDPVLRQIEARTRREAGELVQQQADALIAEATALIERGDAQAAYNKLLQASGLAGFDRIKPQLESLQKQAQLWQTIQGQIEDGYARRNSSVGSAVESLGKALRAATHPDGGLTTELRANVSELLALENDLHLEDAFSHSDAYLNTLQAAGAEHRLFTQYQLGPALRAWRDLARQKAAEGLVTSLIELNTLEEAYAEAKKQVRAAPNNPRFLELSAEARGRLRTRLLELVRERRNRAQELAEKGAYTEALQALDEVGSKWIAPMEQKFPEIIENDAEIMDEQAKAADLRIMIQPLQEKAQGLAVVISQIQSVYAARNLDKAEELLRQADATDRNHSAKIQWAQLEDLRQQTRLGRQDTLREGLRRQLDAAAAVLMAEQAEVVRKVLNELSAMRAHKDQHLTGPEDEGLRAWYAQTLTDLQNRLDQLEREEKAQQVAAQAAQSDTIAEMEVALKSLQRALGEARGGSREALQVKFDTLTSRLEMRRAQEGATRSLQELWHAALADLEAGNYQKAQQGLRDFSSQARSLGQSTQDVEPYRRAAEAGLHLQRARELMSTYPEEAQRVLSLDVLATTEGCAPAAVIRESAQRYLAQLQDMQRVRAEEEKRRAAERLQQDKEAADRDKRVKGLLNTARRNFRADQFDEAQNALDELFGIQADHGDALALQTQVDQALQASALVQRANQQRDAGDYDGALALVKQALELRKGFPEATRLQELLGKEAEAGAHLTRARSLIRDNQFGQAREELKQARQKHPGHPKLNEVQDAVAAQEASFRRRMLDPVDEARHRNDFRTALRLLAQIKQQVGASDLGTEVGQLQQTMVNEWAEYQTTQAKRLFDALSPDADLARVIEQRDTLQEILAQKPTGHLEQPLRSLMDQIDRQRLQRRLAEARQARDAGDLDTAETIADDVYGAANKLPQVALAREATQLKMDIVRRQEQREAEERAARQQQAQEKHTQTHNAARERLATAASLADLNEARRLARQALEVEGFADDAETLQTQQEVDREIQRYRATMDALEEVKGFLYSQTYRRALDRLQELEMPSRLLQAQVNQRQSLARNLENASNQEIRETETALRTYQQAIQVEPGLANNLQKAVDRCRTTLFNRATDDIRGLLDAPVPDHERAAGRLQSLIEAQWVVTPEQQHEVDGLRQRIENLRLTAAAAQTLNQGQDVAEAKRLLEEVRSRSRDGRLDAASEGWLRVAESLQALALAQRNLDQNEIDAARRLAEQIPETLNNQAAVRKLRADLASCDSLASTVYQAETAARAALAKLPPDFGQAAAAARQAPHARGQRLRQEVQSEIQKALQALREQERYAELSALVEHWRGLASGAAEPQQWLDGAEAERKDRLEGCLRLAGEALTTDALDKTRTQLERARGLAAAADGPRIEQLAQAVEQRVRELGQVNTLVDQTRQALASEDMPTAVETTLRAQGLAPRYDRVVQLQADLRATLEKQVRGRMAADRLEEGLSVCEQALRLGAEVPFPALRDELQNLQRTKQARLREQADRAHEKARAALVIFDLPGVRSALDDGKRARPEDGRWATLENQLITARAQEADLRRLLEEAWQSLRERNFEGARSSLQLMTPRAPDFAEPGLWQRYLGNIMDGVKAVENQQHAPAARYFAEAEKVLRIAADQPVSPLWPNLLSERRRAVYYAARLRGEAELIANDWERGTEFQRLGDVRRALDMMRQVQNRQNQFKTLVNTVVEPPADFDATTGRGSPVASPPASGQGVAPATAAGDSPAIVSPTPTASPAPETPPPPPVVANTRPIQPASRPEAESPAPVAPPPAPVVTTQPTSQPTARDGADRASSAADTPTLVLPVTRPAPAQTTPAAEATPRPAQTPAANPPAPEPATPAETQVSSYDDWFGGQTLVIPEEKSQEKKS